MSRLIDFIKNEKDIHSEKVAYNCFTVIAYPEKQKKLKALQSKLETVLISIFENDCFGELSRSDAAGCVFCFDYCLVYETEEDMINEMKELEERILKALPECKEVEMIAFIDMVEL